MKGILPVYCRTMGYVVLLLSVFVPLFMFMFGMINDSNLLFTKASIKLLIWFSLFMIFLAKVKDENEKISRIRIKAICYAIYLLGIYYIVMLVRGVYNGNLEEADNSIAIVYMVFNVICLEFGVTKKAGLTDCLRNKYYFSVKPFVDKSVQRTLGIKISRKKNEEVNIIVVTGMYLCNSLLGAKWQAHNRDGICD